MRKIFIAACTAALVCVARAEGPRGWGAYLDVPHGYATFTRCVERVVVYTNADFDVEVYRQANGPTTSQRVMMAVPHGRIGKTPCVIAPFYFPEAMLGYDPQTGTNLAAYAGITYMTDLAHRGYITLSAEAYHLTYATNDAPRNAWAKWRHAGEALARDWPAWTGMGKLLFDTRLLIDLAVADARVDADRIGIIGHSLGGKMAFYAGCLDARIKVIVASDFGMGWTQTNWQDIWYFGPRVNEMRAAGLSHADLLSFTRGKPMCLIAGKYDDADSGAILHAAQGYAAQDERLRFIHHGQGHRPPASATQMGYDFLDKWLKQTK